MSIGTGKPLGLGGFLTFSGLGAKPPPGGCSVTLGWVPRISAFYGIVIWMYHDEVHHLGRPHFHASYSGDEASIDIESLDVLAGGLPPRAHRLVVEWPGTINLSSRENWELARRNEPLRKIAPLP